MKMKVRKRRQRERKTDYKARIALLKSGKDRIIFRKSNQYITGQGVESQEAKDKVIVGVTSKNLLEYGWPKENSGSLKNISACYLTGYLLGKKILSKDGKQEFVFDLGLIRNQKKSKIYGFLKGVVDSGIKIKVGEDVFPDEKKLAGESLKIKIDINQIKENINKKHI